MKEHLEVAKLACQLYPSAGRAEEGSLVAPYLVLLAEDAPPRSPPLRAVFNGLRWLVQADASCRMLPHDLPPWASGYHLTHRWLVVGALAALRPLGYG